MVVEVDLCFGIQMALSTSGDGFTFSEHYFVDLMA
jgi:hypothetical protein